MRGDPIPENYNVARYCGNSTLDENGDPSSSSFSLRKGETYLSVTCLELAGGDSTLDQLNNVRISLSQNLNLGANACLAILGVEFLIKHVLSESSDQRRLSVLHEPPPEPHCGIHNIKEDDMLVEALLAECVSVIHPAK